jgi:hypothetical protein
MSSHKTVQAFWLQEHYCVPGCDVLKFKKDIPLKRLYLSTRFHGAVFQETL